MPLESRRVPRRESLRPPSWGGLGARWTALRWGGWGRQAACCHGDRGRLPRPCGRGSRWLDGVRAGGRGRKGPARVVASSPAAPSFSGSVESGPGTVAGSLASNDLWFSRQLFTFIFLPILSFPSCNWRNWTGRFLGHNPPPSFVFEKGSHPVTLAGQELTIQARVPPNPEILLPRLTKCWD